MTVALSILLVALLLLYADLFVTRKQQRSNSHQRFLTYAEIIVNVLAWLCTAACIVAFAWSYIVK